MRIARCTGRSVASIEDGEYANIEAVRQETLRSSQYVNPVQVLMAGGIRVTQDA